jgi:Ser/Thr protein kinase RdoA (MazF antagonist)
MIPGTTAEGLLAQTGHCEIADRIAAALDRLHSTAIPARREHTLSDELGILEDRYQQTSAAHPDLADPLRRILKQCTRVAARLPSVTPTGIHRDFYPAQVMVAGDRIYLLDLDLYTAGDPALDAGNFVGHLIEQGLRRPGERAELQNSTERFVETYSAITDCNRDHIAAYAFLTLARHVALSTILPHRSHTTHELIRLCEGGTGRGRFRREWFRRIVAPTIGRFRSSSS